MLTTLKLLDRGFVELFAVHGDEYDIPRIARVSTGSKNRGKEMDRKLIEYLMKHGHLSVFEFVSFVFYIKAPLFVVNQWQRHRIGVSYSQKSLRYTKADGEFYVPKYLRGKDAKYNKQGSSDVILDKKYLDLLQKGLSESIAVYKVLEDAGVSNELSRLVLPTAIYTEFYWKVNLRALMHFLNLRLDFHAQFEMVEYAKAIDVFFEEYFPTTHKAYKQHIYKGNI